VAGLLGVFFWYLPLIKQNQKFRERIVQLDSQLAEQERMGRYLRASAEAVQNDPRTLERMIRERMGYSRTNEIVVKFEGPEDRIVPR
jgi:hypothetical protein